MNQSSRRAARVLVVDDNDDDIELLRIAFARVSSTCTMTAVTSIAEAQRALQDAANRPDLVFLDWKMPGMHGPDFVKTVRKEPRLAGIPIFVFSSSDAPSDVRTAYDAGATAYLVKPPGLAEYEAFVRDVNAFWTRPVLYPS